jgi:hypothetical protein
MRQVLILDTSVIGRLIEVLEQETKIYDDLLKISRDKTDIIVEGKVSELENIVKLEQSYILSMSKLENVREALVEKLSSTLGLDASEMTISTLTNYANDECVKKLKTCQMTMSTLLNDLKDINSTNSKLIKNSLEYIDFSINILTAADAANNTYENTGQVKGSKKRSFIDMKL